MEEDILADFLVEAGELIDELGGQLVALESAPDDPALINAVFRAFHTVKGGAGFLNLQPVVRLCHAGEEVCNAVRGGKLALTPAIVDHISAAVDLVQSQLRAVGAGEAPSPAPPKLLDCLAACLPPAPSEPAVAAPKAGAPKKTKAAAKPAKTAARTARKKPVASAPPPAVISDDEFEALLDDIHGSGKPPAVAAPPPPAAEKKPAPVESPAASAAAPRPPAETTVRVDIRRLDKVLNLVGELVLVRNRLKTRGDGSEDTLQSIAELDQITSRLQASVMSMRMQPISKVFGRFPKLVRDVARSLGKEVTVSMSGEETELDRNLVEALADPLVHMVRNAVDHGIETPERREAAGKPRAGTLTLDARQEGDSIAIRICDDGAGIDPNRLRTRAIDKGVIGREEAARLDARECFQILFLPGFSTRDEVTELSGRGVGMDVVKTRINALNGQIEIDSELGAGSRFEIKVPLTLAILPTLMVNVAGRVFAIPLSVVSDVIVLDPKALKVLDCRDVLQVRGEALPVLDLRRWAGAPDAAPEVSRHVVVVRAGSDCFCLVVDAVRAREEVVIKPLGRMLQGLAGFAGATVTGDGRVALILDMPGMLKVLGDWPKQKVTPSKGS